MDYIVPIAILLVFFILWSISGVVIGKNFYSKVKNEEQQERGKVIQRIMKTYALVQCICWPLFGGLAFLLYLNKTVMTIFPPVLIRPAIILSRFTFTVFRTYIGFNSLVIAICRYSFVVLENQALEIGIKRLRKAFLVSSVSIPIFIALLNEASIPTEIVWLCLFAPRINQTILMPDENELGGILCTKSNVGQVGESPVYSLFHGYLPEYFDIGMEICAKVLIWLIFLNVLEGFMYIHTFSYMRR